MDLSWRPLTEKDVPDLTRLMADAEKVDDTGEHNDEDDIAEWLSSPTLDLSSDSRGGFGVDGSLLAAGLVMAPESVRTEDRISLEGVVHPSVRRQGIGTSLLRWQEERAAALHESRHPSLPGETELGAYEHVGSQRALAAANGYRDVRWWNEMRHDLAVLPPVPAVPSGLRVEPVTASWYEPLRVAHNDAFAEHYGSSERSPETWAHWFMAPSHFKPDLSLVALDGEAVAAYLLTHFYPADAAATGRRTAWVGQLGTLRPYRKRGLGTLLLTRGLATFHEAGYDACELGVDTENATGALGLYERIGFVSVRRTITSVKQLAPPR